VCYVILTSCIGTDNIVVVQKPLKRGYDFFYWGYVHEVEIFKEGGMCYVQSKCWASQRKAVKYSQKVMISKEGVEYAACYTCPAGRNGGLCQHVFALLLVLEKYCLKTAGADNELPGPQSCTSIKQTWGPRKRDIDPKPIMQTTVERAKDEKERKRGAVKCTLYEARDELAQNLTADDIISFKNSLEKSSRLFSILPEVDTDVTFTRTQFGLAPKGSVLSCHLPVLSAAVQPDSKSSTPDVLTQSKVVINAGKQMLPFCDHVNCTLLPMTEISLDESRQIEKATMGQHNCDLWKQYHTITLTSSNFKRICSRKISTSDSFVSSLLHSLT